MFFEVDPKFFWNGPPIFEMDPNFKNGSQIFEADPQILEIDPYSWSGPPILEMDSQLLKWTLNGQWDHF